MASATYRVGAIGQMFKDELHFQSTKRKSVPLSPTCETPGNLYREITPKKRPCVEEEEEEEGEREEEYSSTKRKRGGVKNRKNLPPNDARRQPMNPEEEAQKTIFVGNLPSTTKLKDVKRLFTLFGEIVNCRMSNAIPLLPEDVTITKDKRPHKRSLNAYVRFVDAQSVEDALSMNAEVVEGHHIRVDRTSQDKVHDHKRSVFVGNMPLRVDEESLRACFEEYDEVEAVRIVRDKQTGLGKGIGYILFKSKDGVELALKATVVLEGRTLRLERSTQNPRPKPKLKIPKKKAGKIRSMLELRRNDLKQNRPAGNTNSWQQMKGKPRKTKDSQHSTGNKNSWQQTKRGKPQNKEVSQRRQLKTKNFPQNKQPGQRGQGKDKFRKGRGKPRQ